MSLPDDVKEHIDRYVKDGVPPGSFLRAVLANDLMNSFGNADETNSRSMLHICCYIYNSIPEECHGSYEKVEAWIYRKCYDRHHSG